MRNKDIRTRKQLYDQITLTTKHLMISGGVTVGSVLLYLATLFPLGLPVVGALFGVLSTVAILGIIVGAPLTAHNGIKLYSLVNKPGDVTSINKPVRKELPPSGW